MLMQQLLPAICSIAGDMFVFEQDSAPAHRARDTVELLRRETPQFVSPDMWPANSLDLNPVDYRIWGMMQERVDRVPIQDMDQLRQRLVETWLDCRRASWMRPLTNGGNDWERASIHRVVTLNTLCSIASIYFATQHNWFFSEPPNRLF